MAGEGFADFPPGSSKPGPLNIHSASAEWSICAKGAERRNNTRVKKEKSGRDSEFLDGGGSFESCHRRENKLRLSSKPNVGKSRRLCLFVCLFVCRVRSDCQGFGWKEDRRRGGAGTARYYSLRHRRLIMFSGPSENSSEMSPSF